MGVDVIILVDNLLVLFCVFNMVMGVLLMKYDILVLMYLMCRDYNVIGL